MTEFFIFLGVLTAGNIFWQLIYSLVYYIKNHKLPSSQQEIEIQILNAKIEAETKMYQYKIEALTTENQRLRDEAFNTTNTLLEKL